jgi:NADPH-dependent ferric siderophore reductase
VPSTSKVILAEVHAVTRLTPHMSRITPQLDGLAEFDQLDHQRVPLVR